MYLISLSVLPHSIPEISILGNSAFTQKPAFSLTFGLLARPDVKVRFLLKPDCYTEFVNMPFSTENVNLIRFYDHIYQR